MSLALELIYHSCSPVNVVSFYSIQISYMYGPSVPTKASLSTQPSNELAIDRIAPQLCDSGDHQVPTLGTTTFAKSNTFAWIAAI
jgi:hypothetical protein